MSLITPVERAILENKIDIFAICNDKNAYLKYHQLKDCFINHYKI